MKVLHIITGLKIAGAERSLHSLLKGGLAEIAENQIISLTNHTGFAAQIRQLGVPVHILDLSRPSQILQSLVRLRQIARDASPDIIQGWMYHGNLAASAACFMVDKKPKLAWNIRHSLHDIKAEKPSLRVNIRVGKQFSSKPDIIFYNSQISREQHEKLGFTPIAGNVVPNGFDMDYWRPNPAARSKQRADFKLLNDDLVIGFAARFHPMKDIPNFLKALQIVTRANPNVKAVIIGKDVNPQNLALAGHISDLPADKIQFLDERQDIKSLFQMFDLFCLSSAYGEAFPNVLAEAMASGVSCVSTDVGECRHIVGGTGRIVPVSNPEAFANAILEQLEQPLSQRHRASVAVRERIEQNFSLDKTVNQYASSYRRLMEGR